MDDLMTNNDQQQNQEIINDLNHPTEGFNTGESGDVF